MKENENTSPLDDWTFIRLFVPDYYAALTTTKILLDQGYNVVVGPMNSRYKGIPIEISKNF